MDLVHTSNSLAILCNKVASSESEGGSPLFAEWSSESLSTLENTLSILLHKVCTGWCMSPPPYQTWHMHVHTCLPTSSDTTLTVTWGSPHVSCVSASHHSTAAGMTPAPSSHAPAHLTCSGTHCTEHRIEFDGMTVIPTVKMTRIWQRYILCILPK